MKRSSRDDHARASAVIVTRPGEPPRIMDAYSEAEARRIVQQGQETPRAWNDPGSGRYGGGNDFIT